MKILVTGANGFIGSNLINTLSNVVADKVIRYEEPEFDLAGYWRKHLVDFLEENKPSTIFHVGACSNTLETDVNYIMCANFEITKVLVDYSIKHKAKLIYSSSAANYGVNDIHPSNLYGWSKYVAEQYVVSNKGIALRYYNVFGPGESHKGRMASVAYQALLHNFTNPDKDFILYPGRPLRDFIYIKDVIEANLHADKYYDKLSAGNFYEVGTAIPHSFENILDHLKIPFVYTTPDKKPVGYQNFTCSNKAKWMLDWKPKYTLEAALDDYKDYFNRVNQ